MKKIITAAAALLLTTSVFASTITVSNHATKMTDTYSTKAAAYNAGFDLSDSIKSMSESELRHEFPVATYTMVRKIAVDDSKVTVEEIATERNNVQYRAIVDLGYHFSAHESSN